MALHVHVVRVAGPPGPVPYLRERGRRRADDVRGHSGAATDARAVDGRHGVRRGWAQGRRAEGLFCSVFSFEWRRLAGWYEEDTGLFFPKSYF